MSKTYVLYRRSGGGDQDRYFVQTRDFWDSHEAIRIADAPRLTREILAESDEISELERFMQLARGEE